MRLGCVLLVLLSGVAASSAEPVGPLRRVEGQHLTLVTDVPPGPAIDALPAQFDAAVPQWCEYFRVAPSQATAWHITGCLMRSRTRFTAAGLLGADVPPFRHGYALGKRLWLDDQPSDYYRRHLLFHEGTHAFMQAFVGDGPPWYREGLAELLATHRLDSDDRLRLADFPTRKTDVPRWGRIALVRDAVAGDRGLRIADVLKMGPTAHQQDEAYGWCWALATFLDHHPRYRAAFRQWAADADRSPPLLDLLSEDSASLSWSWNEFVTTLDYGHDFDRATIEPREGTPLEPAGRTVSIRADRGWQSSGARLEASSSYALSAHGRFVVARTSRDWPCEADGVSLRYHDGRPLGRLLGTVVHDDGTSTTVQVMGSRAILKPTRGGTLYLKVNDSPSELADNSGELFVTLQRQ